MEKSKLTRIALILVLGMTAPAIGATIVNEAILSLVKAFNTNIETAQWLTTGYILMMGVGVPLSAWLINRFDGKKVYLYSLAGFTITMILTVFSPNIGWLIAFRVTQGFAVGIIMPVMQTLLVLYAGGKNLGNLISVVAIPAAIFPILGPVVGGLIVNYLPWQWIFIVPLPLCVLGIIFTAKLPPVEPANRTQKLDFIGLILLTGAFCAFIFGITKLRTTNLPLAFGMLASGVALIVLYCVYVTHAKTVPLLDIRLFAKRNFTMSTLLTLIYGAIATGVLFILPLYFQQIRGTTAFVAGLLLVPQGAGMFLSRSIAGKWTDKFGARPVVLGGILLTLAGTIPLALIGRFASLVPEIIVLIIRGAGLGMLSVPVMVCIYEGLDTKDAAQGTVSSRMFMQIGSALGTAVLAIVLSHVLANTETPLTAFNTAYWCAVWITVLCVVPAMLLTGKNHYRQSDNSGELIM
ncbi:MAG: DHA2 family efflux MFS transporter permease subunit [Treponema sp.]|jgi:EmrB/QacA subfamily drug resistance transporter|nr:DHA2 family efflux MFS transporter permease subunit [Treponema sp.]